MLKLFRNIRKTFIDNGQARKYFLYAVGEILLIMVGILLALSVDNWNTDRQLRAEEQNTYRNIRRQLEEDRLMVQNNRDFNQRYYEQYQFALRTIAGNDRSRPDSLSRVLFNLLEYSDVHREGNIHAALVSSGEIKLLRNQGIIEALQWLEETFIYINRIEDTHLDLIKTLYPELRRLIRFDAPAIERADDIYTFEFRNDIVILMDIMREKDDVYQRALTRIDTILALIDAELAE